MEDDRTRIDISIDYIGPRHLDHVRVLFDRVKQDLEDILKDKPSRSLSRIVKPWPFDIYVKSSLNGVPLNTPMEFLAKK